MTAKSEYTRPKSKTSARKHTQYPIEWDWYTDPKFTRVIAECGMEGAGVCFVLSGKLAREHTHSLPLSIAEDVDWQMHLSPGTTKKAIDSGLRSGLFKTDLDSDQFYSNFISEACSEYEARCEQLRSNGSKAKAIGSTPKAIASDSEATGKQLLEGEKQTQDSQSTKTVNQSGQSSQKVDHLEAPHRLDKYFCPDTPELQADPQRIAGRRPLKDFPAIWLTAGELEQIIELHKQCPEASQKRIFQRAQAKAASRPKWQQSTFNAYAALTGYELENELKVCKAAADAKRAEIYAANAGEVRP